MHDIGCETELQFVRSVGCACGGDGGLNECRWGVDLANDMSASGSRVIVFLAGFKRAVRNMPRGCWISSLMRSVIGIARLEGLSEVFVRDLHLEKIVIVLGLGRSECCG